MWYEILLFRSVPSIPFQSSLLMVSGTVIHRHFMILNFSAGTTRLSYGSKKECFICCTLLLNRVPRDRYAVRKSVRYRDGSIQFIQIRSLLQSRCQIVLIDCLSTETHCCHLTMTRHYTVCWFHYKPPRSACISGAPDFAEYRSLQWTCNVSLTMVVEGWAKEHVNVCHRSAVIQRCTSLLGLVRLAREHLCIFSGVGHHHHVLS